MTAADSRDQVSDPDRSMIPTVAQEPELATPPAWEEIAAGRYRPRRIRGSCRGRELG